MLKKIVFLSLAIGVLAHLNHNQNDSCTKHDAMFSINSVAIISAVVFPLIGILPALFIRTHEDETKFVGSLFFKCLLGFAAGSLLADVMLHLLPETMSNVTEPQALNKGIQIIGSFLLFMVIEKVGDFVTGARVLGVLNLIANVFDNSAHGMTVVNAFENSIKFGLVALIATVIHEIPHEFSDFALLLRDGYSRNKAIFFQILTSLVGIISATISYSLSSNYAKSNYCSSAGGSGSGSVMLEGNHNHNTHIGDHHAADHHGSIFLPFTIGGFLYISLVGIVPDIMEEENLKHSAVQVVSFLVGIVFIYLLVQIEAILPIFFA